MQQTSKLTVTLPNDLEIVLTRSFDAPKHLVFEAFTKCEHYARWWGLRDMTLAQCEMDFRVGGRWRRVLRMPDGSEHPFRGEFIEIVPTEKIVQTFVYDVEFIRDHPSIETMELTEEGGRTTLTATVRHKTKEARDGHLQSGMESGASESYDRLEELLAELQG
ncbi:MAG TPA: SRPBCC family protein [Fimbriimonadaceae bacterium]|nr:SRPBCC family protein [Fimbriimonadaceae bacterium]HRJ95296.1 SRPBCC family protein [Fimbriimonadaceae bacterium]